MTSQDTSTLMRLAHELKAAGRLEEAVFRYGEAVAANPRSAEAELHLAASLADAGRWTEADSHSRQALGLGLDAPGLWVIRGRCEQALGRLDAAQAAYRKALDRQGDHADAHRRLAELVWMRTGAVGPALEALDRAIEAASPANATLRAIKAEALDAAGETERAFEMAAQLANTHGQPDTFAVRAARLAARLGRADEAVAFAQRAQAIDPHALDVQLALAEALLAAGDAQRASDVAGDLRRKWSTNQTAIAIQATAWRLLGDPAWKALGGDPGLSTIARLDAPRPWTDVQTYLAEFGEALGGLHPYREAPFDHPARHASHAGDLQRQSHPALRALCDALDGPIRRWLAALGEGDDPVRARNRGAYRLQDAWSIRLHPGGQLANHVHPQGWISGLCNVGGAGRACAVRLGRPGVTTRPRLKADRIVPLKPGEMLLFPSGLWHGIGRIGSEDTHDLVAFTLVPGEITLPDDGEDS